MRQKYNIVGGSAWCLTAFSTLNGGNLASCPPIDGQKGLGVHLRSTSATNPPSRICTHVT